MRHLRRLYASAFWRVGIGLVVLVNSTVLGAVAEVAEGSRIATRLDVADDVLLCILVADVLLCLAVKRWAVLNSGWDIFDITVTLVSVVPNIGMLSAFRVLRVIRVLRLISFVPHGRAMVDALLHALRNMVTAFVVLGVVFYSFVVITTSLFRDEDLVHYGTLGRTAAHLYTVMVNLGSGLDTEAVLDGNPWALPLYAAFIIVASFGLLNMFIAVLVAALKEQLEADQMREERARFDRLERKLDALAASIEAGKYPRAAP
jgi:voltage-gated sodium channel